MAKAPKIYTRLTRNAAGLGSYSSLWLAADHLLIVKSSGYNEEYARVELRDIKGIFLIPGNRRLWWGLVWGIIAGPAAVTMISSIVRDLTPVASVIFFVIGTVGLVWNHLLGAGCRAFIVTGVQTAPLPALVRIKKARRVLGRLQPLIDAAQADLAATAPLATPSASPTPPSP